MKKVQHFALFLVIPSMIISLLNSRSLSHCTWHSGFLIIYGIFQGLLLVSFHAVGLCWSIVFPFHYRRFKLEGRIKYIHAISIVHVLVVPAIFPLLHLIGGYRISPSPLETCVGGSMLITYFATILPISILMATATSVLVIFFWKILKVAGFNCL